MELTRQQISDLKGKVFRREVRLAAPDGESRVVSASISSELPVERWFGNEVLAHDEDSISLERLKDGRLPLLAIHDDRQWPIGAAFDLKMDNAERKWRGRLQFAQTDRAEEPFKLHRQGIPLGVSVGYSVDWDAAEYDKESDTYTFRKWTPMEVSIVPVEADHTIGIGRNLEVKTMTDKAGGNSADQAAGQADKGPSDYKEALEIGKRSGEQAAIEKERKRVNDIDALFQLPNIPRNELMAALRQTSISNGWGVEQVKTELLYNIGNADGDEHTRGLVDAGANDDQQQVTHEYNRPDPMGRRQPDQVRVQVGKDALDKFKEAASNALEVRCGLRDQRKQDDREFIRKTVATGYAGMSLSDMAREYLDITGTQYRGLRPEEIAGRAFTTRASGLTTSDFTNLLNNIASKSMLMGWEEIPETWRMISRIGSLPDFKIADRPGLSHFSDLDEVPDNGDIKYGDMSDYKETIRLVEYAKKFRLSRRTIINDDLDGLSRVPRLMGRAAARKVGDKVYDTLTSNSHVGPTLNQDSVALFNAASHSNYVASGGGGAPTVTTIDAGKTAMGTQTDPSGNAILNISPRYLLVPKAIETTATVLMTSQFDPAGTTASKSTRDAPNPFRNAFEVVAEARLDSASHGNLTTGWYLVADPNLFDTVEVAFLNGVAEPYLREEEEWDTRGVEYVVGIDCGVAFLDFRGWYFNYGA